MCQSVRSQQATYYEEAESWSDSILNHLDLFSGIGGFAIAVDKVWSEVTHTFCEIDPYCRALLKLRYPKARIYDDIRELTTDTYNRRSEKQELQTTGHKQCDRKIELLTGGFPCQPFSQAGKRRGTEDNRYLWPEMLRVIRDFKPTWVIAENVRGILSIEGGVVFEQVCLDLEAQDYEVQPFVIPAVAVNAPHRRDRVWILAFNTTSERRVTRCGDRKERQVLSAQVGQDEENKQTGDRWLNRIIERNNSWDKSWLEVATRLCGMDDGLPAGVDGFELSKAKHRVERLKALGNAIVPQVAVEIMRGIKGTI